VLIFWLVTRALCCSRRKYHIIQAINQYQNIDTSIYRFTLPPTKCRMFRDVHLRSQHYTGQAVACLTAYVCTVTVLERIACWCEQLSPGCERTSNHLRRSGNQRYIQQPGVLLAVCICCGFLMIPSNNQATLVMKTKSKLNLKVCDHGVSLQ
jgi:hypothetical protein